METPENVKESLIKKTKNSLNDTDLKKLIKQFNELSHSLLKPKTLIERAKYALTEKKNKKAKTALIKWLQASPSFKDLLEVSENITLVNLEVFTTVLADTLHPNILNKMLILTFSQKVRTCKEENIFMRESDFFSYLLSAKQKKITHLYFTSHLESPFKKLKALLSTLKITNEKGLPLGCDEKVIPELDAILKNYLGSLLQGNIGIPTAIANICRWQFMEMRSRFDETKCLMFISNYLFFNFSTEALNQHGGLDSFSIEQSRFISAVLIEPLTKLINLFDGRSPEETFGKTSSKLINFEPWVLHYQPIILAVRDNIKTALLALCETPLEPESWHYSTTVESSPTFIQTKLAKGMPLSKTETKLHRSDTFDLKNYQNYTPHECYLYLIKCTPRLLHQDELAYLNLLIKEKISLCEKAEIASFKLSFRSCAEEITATIDLTSIDSAEKNLRLLGILSEHGLFELYERKIRPLKTKEFHDLVDEIFKEYHGTSIAYYADKKKKREQTRAVSDDNALTMTAPEIKPMR